MTRVNIQFGKSQITWAGSGFTEVMEGGGVGEGEGVLCEMLELDLCGE